MWGIRKRKMIDKNYIFYVENHSLVIKEKDAFNTYAARTELCRVVSDRVYDNPLARNPFAENSRIAYADLARAMIYHLVDWTPNGSTFDIKGYSLSIPNKTIRSLKLECVDNIVKIRLLFDAFAYITNAKVEFESQKDAYSGEILYEAGEFECEESGLIVSFRHDMFKKQNYIMFSKERIDDNS